MIRSSCSDKNHPLLKLLSQNSSLILCPEHPGVTVDWHVSLSFIFIQIQSISSHPMLLCYGNTLWERLWHRANGNKHTHAWGISHTCQQSITAGPHTVPTAFTPFDTWEQIYKTLTIKHFWSWAKAHSKGGWSDESRQGSEESKRRMSKSKRCKIVSFCSVAFCKKSEKDLKGIRVVFLIRR